MPVTFRHSFFLQFLLLPLQNLRQCYWVKFDNLSFIAYNNLEFSKYEGMIIKMMKTKLINIIKEYPIYTCLFSFGLIYIKTNSLWAFIAHTFNNTVLNLVHVQTITGVNELQNIRVLLITIIFLTLVLLTKKHESKTKIEGIEA